MLDESVKGWPDSISYSMAPFGYNVYADKTGHTETGVTYTCRDCDFQVRVDPRDMTVQSVSVIMRQHMDQSH